MAKGLAPYGITTSLNGCERRSIVAGSHCDLWRGSLDTQTLPGSPNICSIAEFQPPRWCDGSPTQLDSLRSRHFGAPGTTQPYCSISSSSIHWVGLGAAKIVSTSIHGAALSFSATPA